MTEDESDKSLRAACIVLRRLCAGMPVKFPNLGELTLCNDEDGNSVLAGEFRKSTGGSFYMELDISFKGFMKECAKFSDSDVYLLGCETALYEMKQDR